MLSHLAEQSSLSKMKGELRAYLKEKLSLRLLDQAHLSQEIPSRDGSSSKPPQTDSPPRRPQPDLELEIALEQPRRQEHGHLAWPLFHLAKRFQQAPQQLAEELSREISLSLPSFLSSCEALSGFVNFRFQEDYIQKNLILYMEREDLVKAGPPFSLSKKAEHWVLDFASPNVAKSMNIGHLRAAVLGQALVNLAKAFGFKVTAINHLGDWGSQFGKLLWAYKEWGREYDFKNKAFESLTQLYVRFYDSAESDPQKTAEARSMFKKLEEGDEELKKLWHSFVNLSIENYSHYWKLFKVQHDLVLGESFYVPFAEDLKSRLKKKKLLEPSEGAEVVFLKNSEAPCLISKSDGASTYSSRDLCSMIYRFEKLKADLNIYITGSDQILHFKQIFEVMERLEPDWRSLHLSFGMYRFKGEGKMSTRRGKAVSIQNIVEQAIKRVSAIIQEREPSQNPSPAEAQGQAVQETKKEPAFKRESSGLEKTEEDKTFKSLNKLKIPEQVAIGALIFNDLMQDRIKDVDFNWSKVLDFEGSSGPFVQYSLARAGSLLKKSGFKKKEVRFESLFEDEEEKQLAWLLLQFESVCFQSLQKLKPHFLARYLLSLSKEFNRFYNAKKIIGQAREKDRLLLVYKTHRILSKGLELLNVPRPTVM